MAKQIAKANFAYAAVPAEAKGKLIWFAGQIGKQKVVHAKAGLEMGKMLAEAQGLCGEKPFPEWVESECGFSVRTAYNYMAAHRDFGDCATVAQIELGAMYELTKNKGAKREAIKLADKGVSVTQSMAKKLIKESKPNPPPKPPATPRDAPEDDPPSEPDSAPEPQDYGKCPSCSKTTWTKSTEGVVCAKCNHPHGEPAGDTNEDALKTMRQKTVKTAEALLRAFDDLNLLRARSEYDEAILRCKQLLAIAHSWT